jgi:hypothetical protein
MRHPAHLRERVNLRLVLLFVALVALCLFGVFHDVGTAAQPSPLGPGWSCTAHLFGTVCVRDVARTDSKAAQKSLAAQR